MLVIIFTMVVVVFFPAIIFSDFSLITFEIYFNDNKILIVKRINTGRLFHGFVHRTM